MYPFVSYVGYATINSFKQTKSLRDYIYIDVYISIISYVSDYVCVCNAAHNVQTGAALLALSSSSSNSSSSSSM